MERGPRRHRITVHEYHRMAEVGLLAPDARVELIEGEIIDMPPIGPDHSSVVDRLNRLLQRALGDDAIVRLQGSFRLGEMSEPQPDLLLLKSRPDFYRSEFATGEDSLLAIEVSTTTLRYDRDVKAPLYARHGVPEYWIVDTEHDRLLVYHSPREGAYQQSTVLERPASVAIATLPDVAIDIAGIWAG
jgi:Uma2 family endonuclease